VKASPRHRGGTPWRGRKPRRASAPGRPTSGLGVRILEESNTLRSGFPRSVPALQPLLPVSGRLRAGGRTSAERLRASFRGNGDPSGPSPSRIPQRRRDHPRGGRECLARVGEIPRVGSVRGRLADIRPSGRVFDAVTAQSGHHGVTSRPSRCHVTPSGAARRRGGCYAGSHCRARALLGGSEHGDGNSRVPRASPMARLGLPSTSLRGCVRQVPLPGFDQRCHGRRGCGARAEKETARGYQTSRGERILEGERLWRAQPQGRSRHETRPEGFGAECKARSGEEPNVPATRVRQARDDLPLRA
jgi:hypothetical protein